MNLKCALFGDPDVGKTTLYKLLTGKKPKEYNSRTEQLRGDVSIHNTGIYFFDGPGHSDLKYIKNQVLNVCDVILYLIDVSKPDPTELQYLLNYPGGRPVIVLINKWDKCYDIRTSLKDQVKTKTALYLSLEQVRSQYLKKNIHLKNFLDPTDTISGSMIPISAAKAWGVSELLGILKHCEKLMVQSSVLLSDGSNKYTLYGPKTFKVADYQFEDIFKKKGLYYECRLKMKLDNIIRSDECIMSLPEKTIVKSTVPIYIDADSTEKKNALKHYFKNYGYTMVLDNHSATSDKDLVLCWSKKKPKVCTLWSNSYLQLLELHKKYRAGIMQAAAKKERESYKYSSKIQLLKDNIFYAKGNDLIVGAIVQGLIKTDLYYVLLTDENVRVKVNEIQLNKKKLGSYQGTDPVGLNLTCNKKIYFDKNIFGIQEHSYKNLQTLKIVAREKYDMIVNTPGLGIEPKLTA